MQQQLALGQGIKHLMALETTGFGIDDMEMKRRSANKNAYACRLTVKRERKFAQ